MTPEQLLKNGLKELGITCSKEQISAFMAFLSELKKWSRAYNLTALKTDEDIIIKHFLDSLLYLKVIEDSVKCQVSSVKLKSPKNVIPAEAGIQRSLSLLDSRFYGNDHLEYLQYLQLKICDVGTGAGFPGIPIKILCPEMEITLIEPSRKKAAFLRHIIRILKLKNVTVLEQRLESLGKAYEKSYDVIISRAAFKVKDFLKKVCPYVKVDGLLILSKGPGVFEEIEGLGAAKKILRFELPFVKAQRNLLILRC